VRIVRVNRLQNRDGPLPPIGSASTGSSLIIAKTWLAPAWQATPHEFEALAGVQDPVLVRRMVEIAFGDEPPAGIAPILVSSLTATDPDVVWPVALPHRQDPKTRLANDERWRMAIDIASR
jgi:hypothetical protein